MVVKMQPVWHILWTCRYLNSMPCWSTHFYTACNFLQWLEQFWRGCISSKFLFLSVHFHNVQVLIDWCSKFNFLFPCSVCDGPLVILQRINLHNPHICYEMQDFHNLLEGLPTPYIRAVGHSNPSPTSSILSVQLVLGAWYFDVLLSPLYFLFHSSIL